MNSFISYHANAQLWPNNLPLVVNQKLAEAVEQERKLIPHWRSGEKYESQENCSTNHVVNMKTKECDCRNWQISGISCK